MNKYPQRGSSDPCPFCNIDEANQHSLRQSAKCDWIRQNARKQQEVPQDTRQQ